MTTVSVSDADAVALELERRGMAVGTRGIYAAGDDGVIRLRVSGTKAQWQALLSPTLRPERVAWLTEYAVRVEAIYVRSNPHAPMQTAEELRQWLAQQQGGTGR